MARVVGRARAQSEGAGTGMKLSETGIFIAMGVIAVFAVYWYFVIYKHSPGVALEEYIGAIKSGSVEKQYALIDASDKKMLPTEKDYEDKCKQSRGYTERVIGVTLGKPVPDAKDPATVSIDATITIRGSAGKNLTDNGESAQATDKYVMHKDAEGSWKVVLSKGWPKNLLAQTPNPPGSSF